MYTHNTQIHNIHTYVDTYTYIYTRTCMYIKHMHAYIYTYINTHTQTHTYICTYAHVQACMFIHVHTLPTSRYCYENIVTMFSASALFGLSFLISAVVFGKHPK